MKNARAVDTAGVAEEVAPQKPAKKLGLCSTFLFGTEEKAYFAYIMISTMCRSFEAGIVSSLMSEIGSDLGLSYTMEGIVAASPDFGIVPSGILAIFVLQYFSTYKVLLIGQFVIAGTAFIAICLPSAASLISARALAGLFWGMAAVHYPTWINRYGGEQRTMWLAIYNVFLLVGILLGYAIGAVASSSGSFTWKECYLLEAVLMLLCGVWTYCFSPELLQVVKLENEAPDMDCFGSKDKSPEQDPERQPLAKEAGSSNPKLGPLVTTLMKSEIYIYTILTGMITAGSISFILYFVTENLDALDYWSATTTYVLVVVVFITSPVPGNVAGGWWVQNKCGGYMNYGITLYSSFVSMAISAVGIFALPIFVWVGNKYLYMVSFYILLFFGGAPTPAINGIAVSLLPEATHAGSGIQFALQNLGKVIIPSLGGVIIDWMGDVVAGFNVTLCVFGGASALSSYLAWRAAVAEEKKNGLEKTPKAVAA